MCGSVQVCKYHKCCKFVTYKLCKIVNLELYMFLKHKKMPGVSCEATRERRYDRCGIDQRPYAG